MSEFAIRFLIANLAIGIAVLVVLALRAPVRAMFGARLTYGLWLLVPLAGLATLLPPRVEQIVNFARPAPPELSQDWQPPVSWAPVLQMQDQAFQGDAPAIAPQASAPVATTSVIRETSGFVMPSPFVLAMIVWFAGVIGMAVWQLRRQSRFVSDAKAGFAGPAVVGVIKPRIVTPADFETTFDPSEREMILTHERIHIEGNDARINALAALAGCICWFNPLVHLGAYFMRIDQELACDAAVVIRHPEAKSLYASALLKAQLARAPLPLGCHWPARSEHPLLQRVEMLGRAEPARGRRILGLAVLGLLAATSGVTAWAAMPPEKRIVERQEIERQDRHVEIDRADGPALPGLPAPFHDTQAANVSPSPAPEPQQAANQEQARYSTFVISADRISVETGKSTYEGNVSIRFSEGELAGAVLKGSDPVVIQYPQTRGLAREDVKTGAPFRVSAAKSAFDAPSRTASWVGRVEVRLGDIMIAADQISLQTPASDRTMMRSVRFEEAMPVAPGSIGVQFTSGPPWVVVRGGKPIPRVVIEGNKTIATATIYSLMNLQPDTVVTDEQFVSAMAALDASRLFSNFTYRASDKEVVLTLREAEPVPGGETEALRELRVKAANAARNFSDVLENYEHRYAEYQRALWDKQDLGRRLDAELTRIRQRVSAQQAGAGTQDVVDLRARAGEVDRILAEVSRKYGPGHPDYQRALAEKQDLDAQISRIVNKLPAGFDGNDPVYVRGTVEKIDFSDTTYTAYVRARSVAAGPKSMAKDDDHLWKLSPINYWGDRDRVSKDILNQKVDVSGFNSTDKACWTLCKVQVSTMIKCSVQPTFAPGCAPELFPQAPAQQAFYQQQTPPAPAAAVVRNAFGNGDPIVIRGKVERIDFSDTKYTVFVRASSASWPGGFANQADNSLFELSPTSYWGDRDAVNSDLKGKEVVVQGSRSSTSCELACKVTVVSLKTAQPTALTPITQTPGFSSTDVMLRYDASAATMIQGVVQRIEFGERAFDAYVQLPTLFGVPGQLYQVRSEYRFPRADIEKQLKGKTVYVAGWSAKTSMSTTCASPCGLYATDIRLGTGEIISPAGEKLVTKADGAAAVPRRCFKDASSAPTIGVLRCSDDGKDAPVVDVRSFFTDERYDINTPVTLNGRIVRADKTGFWVEVVAFQPANTPGSEAGQTWFVKSDGPLSDPSSFVGERATFRGYNSKDTSCKPECRMFALGFSAG